MIMKYLTDTKTKVEGDVVTITARIAEKEFGFPVQQVTVGHGVSTNPHHPRHVQISNEALFVKRMGNQEKKPAGIAWLLDELVDVMVNLEPGLTDAPVFHSLSNDEGVSALINSELAVTHKWQVSDDCKEWKDTDHPDSPKISSESGRHYRCIATNVVGSTMSNPIKAK